MQTQTTCRNDYVGNGTTSVFNFSFQINLTSDLVVIETTAGVSTTKVLTTDYTISQNQDTSTGGSITRIAGNLPTGTNLALIRIVPYTQLSSFSNNDQFFPDQYEAAIDRLEMQIQQIKTQLAVCLQFPQAEVPGTAVNTTPSIANRASTVLSFDANGNVVAGNALSASALPNVRLIGVFKGRSAASLTQTGNVATFNFTAHGYAVGDYVQIDGANQSQYNGLFKILSVPTADTFTYAITGSPASPATGTIKNNLWFLGTRALNANLISSIPKTSTGYYSLTTLNTQPDGEYGISLVAGISTGVQTLSVSTTNAAPSTTGFSFRVFNNDTSAANDPSGYLKIELAGIV